MSFIEFLMDYYIYIIIVLVLMIITIIGFLADKRDKKRKKNKKGENNMNNNMGGDMTQGTNVAPTPIQPQNLEANMNNGLNANVNPNMGMNSTINNPNIMEQPLIREDVPSSNPMPNGNVSNDTNGLGYKPLDEQKPKFAPRPVEIPKDNAMGNVNSGLNNASMVNPIPTPEPMVAQPVNPTPTPVATPEPAVTPQPVSPQPTYNQQPTNPLGMGQSVQPQVAPTGNQTLEGPVVNSWDMHTNMTANPAPTAAPTPEPAVTPQPAVAPQTVNPMPNTSNVNAGVVQPAVNPTPVQPSVNPAAQPQPQAQDSGMNFVYGQDAANNQMNNNQDLWKL